MMTEGQRAEAIEAYKRLVLSVGWGFHPDTPFDGYEPPITHVTEGEFERILDDIFGVGAYIEYDPYEWGMTYLTQQDNEIAEGIRRLEEENDEPK